MSAISIERKVTIGNLITIIMFLATLIGTFVSMDRRVTANEVRVQTIKESQDKFERSVNDRLGKIEVKLDFIIENIHKKDN